MNLLNVVLIVVGAALTAAGFARARGPWARYQALRAQDANIARYEAWRGGLRDEGTTGASVAMAVSRRQARDGALLAVLGIALALLGLFVAAPTR
jgi:4-hydroxyphenylpyruvate dioxygenase-like putative hemolysin